MSELEAGFKKAQDNRMSWDQVTFTDATGGLQYVRTLKVAAMVGDVKATSFLIEHDSQRHFDGQALLSCSYRICIGTAARAAMAYTVMALVVMAYVVMALYSYGLYRYSHGPNNYFPV